MANQNITRRKLLKDTTIATIGASLFLNLPVKAYGKTGNTAEKVVLMRNKNVLDNEGKVQKEVIEKMLEEALLKLTGAGTAAAAWTEIFKPSDILGIKSNEWNKLGTPAALEEILQEKAISAGIKPENISIKDRGVLKDPVFQKATALINVRPMRTHAWSGVGSLIKNYIMFVDKPYAYHDDSCADPAAIWKLNNLKEKTRLNILVMLTPLFHGVGPHHFNKQYTWAYNGIIIGFDPVAVDATGLQIIQAKRREYFGDDSQLNPPAKHILLADTRHHIGTADPAKIELIALGDQEGILI
ncbi:MAG: DUF362 domain-containing protein [Bacteroidales bacterium]|nr:DUF362 domain-containing protein [Bacteroidales bacterium]